MFESNEQNQNFNKIPPDIMLQSKPNMTRTYSQIVLNWIIKATTINYERTWMKNSMLLYYREHKYHNTPQMIEIIVKSFPLAIHIKIRMNQVSFEVSFPSDQSTHWIFCNTRWTSFMLISRYSLTLGSAKTLSSQNFTLFSAASIPGCVLWKSFTGVNKNEIEETHFDAGRQNVYDHRQGLFIRMIIVGELEDLLQKKVQSR